MKLSKYNSFVSINQEQTLIFNTLSNSLIKVNQYLYKKIINNDIKSIEKNDLKKLLDKKVFVNNDNFEINRILFESNMARYSKALLKLTIIPTYSCNFNCTYCYEKERPNITWNSKIRQAIKEYLIYSNFNKNHITFYGGEPLLCLNSIIKFIDDIENSHINCSYSFVTNGYLINQDVIRFLQKIKLDNIQITLDGNEKEHNKRRKLTNGNGTYSKIWSNIISLINVNLGDKLSIRINIDKNNMDSFHLLYKQLKKIHSKLHVYPGIIDDPHDLTNKVKDCLISDKEALNFRFKLYDKYNINLGFYSYFPRAECMAKHPNSFVIGANGDLFKCWLDVNVKEKTTGNILSKSISNQELYYNYIEGANQLLDKECIECKIFPICSGGCPFIRLNNLYNNKEKNTCHYAKNNIEKFIKYHFRTKNY